MDLDRPDEGMCYADTALLELQSYLGLTDTGANQGSRLFDEGTTCESGGSNGDTSLLNQTNRGDGERLDG